MIALLIVEDHRVIRAGLVTLVEAFPEVEVVGCAAGTRDALALCREGRPDVVLLGVETLRVDGMDLVEAIVECRPDAGIVVLRPAGDVGGTTRTLDTGVVRHLHNDAAATELRQAISTAAAMPRSRRRNRLGPASGPSPVPAAELSAREREVLALVARGHQNKHIARLLGISEKTVKAHLTRIFRRIGVTSRTQAAVWAQRQPDDTLSGP